MFSKLRGSVSLFLVQISSVSLVLTLGAVACGPKTLPTASDLSLGGSDTGCLARAGASAQRYFQGKATEAETVAGWDCATHSLQLFQTRTRGEREGVYSPQELRAFLEKYFLDGIKIPDGLLTEAMVLKRTLLGGSADELTHQDLERVMALFATFREQSLKLRNFMPISPQAMKDRSEAEVEAAARVLREAAGALGDSLEYAGVPYAFTHLERLLRELHAYRDRAAQASVTQSNEPMLDQLHEHLPLIQALKATLIAPDGDRISGNEWSTLLVTAAQWYGVRLRLQVLHDRYDAWLVGAGRERLVRIVRDIFGLIDGSIARHPREQISFVEFDRLLALTVPQGIAAWGNRVVPLSHAKALMRSFVQRFLGGSERGHTGRAATGLTRGAWERTLSRFEHWNAGQRYLEAMFEAAEHGEPGRQNRLLGILDSGRGYFPAQLSRYTLSELMAENTLPNHFDENKDPGSALALLTDASKRLQHILKIDRPLFPARSDQIFFNGNDVNDGRHSLHGLSTANWMYSLARVMTSGFAEDPARAQTDDDETQSLNFEEFKAFVTSIQDVGIDLKYVDPLDSHQAEKRFREAELFTFAGDGGTLINTRQAAQLLALMLSGKRTANFIHDEIIRLGCPTGEMDPFESLTIDTDCYRRTFYAQIDRFWSNTPRLLAYYHSLQGAELESFQHALEDAARKQGYSPAPINSSDSEGFGMIGQYVEVIFSRFDLDDSGTIDWSESATAFPVFRATLHEISCAQDHCLNSDADLRAVFTYMMAHGKAPSALAFVRWRYLPFFRHLAADRGTLMQIFGALGKPSASDDPH